MKKLIEGVRNGVIGHSPDGTGPSTLDRWKSTWAMGEQGSRIHHNQSNHLSVTPFCSTVQCILGRSGDRGHVILRPIWLFNREDLESLLLTVLGSPTISGFLWEWYELPQSRSYHVHCTRDMDSLPVMGSLTSRTRTLQAVGTIGGTILGAQYRTGVSCPLNWEHWGIPSRNCVLLIETTYRVTDCDWDWEGSLDIASAVTRIPSIRF